MRKRPLPSPAMIVACLALFLALGGTGYAAGHLSAGGVEHPRTAKAKRGPRGKRGPAGPQGQQGPPGPAGPKGSEAIGLLDYEVGEEVENPAETTTFVSVDCPPGLNAVGGGVRTEAHDGRQVINSSYPAVFGGPGPGANRWQAYVVNQSKDDLSAQAFVICAHSAAAGGNLEQEA